MIKNKKILVTGCYGFLAQHLINKLLLNNNTVLGIYNKKYQRLIFNNKKYLNNKKLKIYKLDIKDLKKIRRFIKNNKIDFCIHLAAISQVLNSNIDPKFTFDTNFVGTLNLLEAFRKINPKIKFIFSSSDKVYGDSNKLPYNEDSILNGINPYDASKVCADILSRSYALSFNMKIAVTRSVNIYGPGDVNWDRIFPGTIKCLIENKKPIIRSNGKFLRDYIYIDDVVSGYTKILKLHLNNFEKMYGKAINFGYNKPRSVLNVVNKILNKFKLNIKDNVVILNKTNLEIKDQYSYNELSKRLLNWKPKVGFDQGLKETIKWYKKQI